MSICRTELHDNCVKLILFLCLSPPPLSARPAISDSPSIGIFNGIGIHIILMTTILLLLTCCRHRSRRLHHHRRRLSVEFSVFIHLNQSSLALHSYINTHRSSNNMNKTHSINVSKCLKPNRVLIVPSCFEYI